MRNRSTLPVDLGRLTAGGAEEVRIGAFARRQARRRAMIGAMGVALMGAAVVVYLKLRPEGVEAPAGTRVVRVRCKACGYEGELAVPSGQIFPIPCAHCQQIAAFDLWACRTCGELFVPTPGRGLTRCPRCHGDQVGSAASQRSP